MHSVRCFLNGYAGICLSHIKTDKTPSFKFLHPFLVDMAIFRSYIYNLPTLGDTPASSVENGSSACSRHWIKEGAIKFQPPLNISCCQLVLIVTALDVAQPHRAAPMTMHMRVRIFDCPTEHFTVSEP